jgi:SAM-dependent methyltransferase
MVWKSLDAWWLDELSTDPAYAEEIEPLVLELLQPRSGDIYLDLGCGEGRLMTAMKNVGAIVVGCDLNPRLLKLARRRGSVVQANLPDLSWARSRSFNGAFVGLVLEHLEDESAFFRHVARAVRRGGVLALVINHPVWTSPESSPIEDVGGETLWRPGTYFQRGYTDEPAGRARVRFYHRTLAELLNAAADAGWDLRHVVEAGVSPEQVKRFPDYAGQEHIPRVLGVRWSRR